MNKLAIILVVLLLIMNTMQTVAAEKDSELKDIKVMEKAVADAGMTLDMWQYMIRESISREEADRLADQLESAAEITVEKSSEAVKYFVKTPHKTSGTTELLSLIVPFEEDYAPELMYVVSGENWTAETALEANHLTKQIMASFFSENTTKFACLQASVSGKISGDIVFENIVKKLDVQTLTNIQDNDYTNVTGHTNKLQQSQSMPDSMNVQAALHKRTDGQSTVTVGTPIITTEY